MPKVPPLPPPERPEMTPREQFYLRALKVWTRCMRRPPAMDEFAEYCGKSRNTVHDALVSLEHKGYVQRNHHRKFEVM